MSIIQAFKGIRPTPAHASNIIAPPYDIVNCREARELAREKPWNFLHISKPEIDLPDHVALNDPNLYQSARVLFDQMRQTHILLSDTQPCFYLYRLSTHSHQQTGIFAAVAAAAYENGRIRQHELTQPDKVAGRVQQITALNAQTSPVLLTHRPQAELQKIYHDLQKVPSLYHVIAYDGVCHEMWPIADAAVVTMLSNLLNAISAYYIADGHHRSAASLTVAKNASATLSGNNDELLNTKNYFLAGIFPADELQVLGYHRFITHLGMNPSAFLNALKKLFTITEYPETFFPTHCGEFGLSMGNTHVRLTRLRQESAAHAIHAKDFLADQAHNLDVSFLFESVLQPILQIHDAKLDPRLTYFGGENAASKLTELFTTHPDGCAITVAPTAVETMMQTADQGRIMPPKSTWFEPKLADGLIAFMI